MRTTRNNLVCLLLFFFQINVCYNKERYNPSNDFLLHENAGYGFNSQKDYMAQFPTLKTPSTQFTQSTNIANPASTPKPQLGGKRDYVAPPRSTNSQATTTTKTTLTSTTFSPQLPPKRDYVAPQFPTLRPTGTTALPISTLNNKPGTGVPQSPPKRDYVAPQIPTLRPIGTTTAPKSPINSQPGRGNVKDLINFYDKNGQSDNKQLSLSPQSPTGNLPTKPLSFSAVVSGSNQGDHSSKSTSRPNTPIDSNGIVQTKNPTVLPSTIVNNNGNQASNNKKGGPSDLEIQLFSEELLKKDTNNAAKYVTINYQEKTTSMSKDDKALSALLTIAPEVWNISTVQTFLPLLDNYERDTLVNEHVTSQERTEENAFMDAVMATSVMRHLMTFLKEKGYVTPDPKQQRDFVKQLWFGMYSRGKGKISSSGFEHIFLSELKNGEVSGLHNWIYFSKEEAANRVNYLGYLKYVPLSDKGTVIKMHYNQQGVDKPVGSMFIGTSPELEMALYTLCYITRVDEDCNLKLGSKDVKIVTYNYRYRSKNYIGSGYPQI